MGIDRDDRIKSRTFLVVGLDSIQVELDQSAGRQPAGLVSVLNILDCRFRKVKWFGLALAFAWKKRTEKEQREEPTGRPQNISLLHNFPHYLPRMGPFICCNASHT